MESVPVLEKKTAFVLRDEKVRKPASYLYNRMFSEHWDQSFQVKHSDISQADRCSLGANTIFGHLDETDETGKTCKNNNILSGFLLQKTPDISTNCDVNASSIELETGNQQTQPQREARDANTCKYLRQQWGISAVLLFPHRDSEL